VSKTFGKALIPIIGVFLVIFAVSNGRASEELNIYSARHYDTDLMLYERFTEETGIKLNLIEGKSEELLARLAQEGEFSPGDVLLTVDAGRLWRAEEAGLFAPIASPLIEERIPAHLRHPDGLWFGISKRARVVIYNKDAGAPQGLTTYADLADPSLAGQVCVRSSSNIYNISLLASIIAQDGAEAAEAWAEGVVANFARAPQGNDTAQIRAVAAGECRVGIANTYYVARLMRSDDEADRAVAEKIGVIFPEQETRGTHVNISGAGLLAHAPNKDNAVRFLEFLTSDWAQKVLADGNNEYPAVASVAAEGPVTTLGTFKEDEINASALGENQSLAIRIYDRAGWR
jgi:iron(III) transport system substrate-binding protein